MSSKILSHQHFHEILQYSIGKLSDKYQLSVVQNVERRADCKQYYCSFSNLQIYFEVDYCLPTCRSE